MEEAERETERQRDYFYLIVSLASLFDIWKLDRRNSSGKENKVLYLTRATCEYKKTRDFAEFLSDLRLFDSQN